MRLFRPLDRYVFAEFWKIFVVTALGFPILLCVIDLTDHLESYLNRQVPPGNIALSYVFWIPDSMFMVLPAAVLFATVFSIGSLTRYSEITASKASGISFYRFIAPIFVGALFAVGLGLVLGEVAPHTNKRRLELLETQKFANNTDRFNFAYASDGGRVYKIAGLHLTTKKADGVEIERRGSGPDYPSYIATAENATYTPRGWVLGHGTMHILTGNTTNITFTQPEIDALEFEQRDE